MRKPLFAAGALLALTAGVAQATPQETFNQDAQITGTFGAFGFQGNAQNGVATFTATGGYTLRRIGLSGTITEGPSATATFGKETGILVTPPGGGQQFIMMPFLDAGFTGSTNVAPGYFAVPLTAADPAGVWTLNFIEMFDDGGATAVDATWSGLQIVFDDAAPVLPGAPAGAVATQVFTDVPSDGLTGTSIETRTLSYAGASTISGFEISGLASVVNGRLTSISASPLSEIRIGLTPPGGTEIVVQPFLDPSYSPSVGTITASLPAPITGTGDWTMRFFESAESNPGIDSMWDSVRLSILNPAPPASVTLNPEGSPGVFVEATQTVALPGEIKWFSFTLTTGVDTGATSSLDIDTEGSSATDTAIGLYSSSGARIVTDFDDGTGLLSQITFGAGLRFPPGNGQPYNGRDGATLAPGTYYVAVSADNTAVFQPGLWGVTVPTPVNTGDVKLRVRYYPVNAPVETPPVAATLSPESTPGTFVTADVAVNSGQVTWVAINVPTGASGGAGQALDIDMEGTGFDTNFGLYRATGALVDSDTADGTDTLPALTYGSGLRFPPGNGLPYNGRDGAEDITPGTYYLAINGGGGAFGASFAATNTGANTGTATVRARWYSVAPFESPTVAATLDPENNPGTFVAADFSVNSGAVTWVRINLPSGVATASGQALDIDTEASALGPANNPNIGLYNALGTLITSDTDEGTDLQAQLTYGTGLRFAPGNGLNYNGRDAANLAAGTYYVAVNGGAGAFGATFGATNTGANTGLARVRARYYPSDAPFETPAVAATLSPEPADGTFVTANVTINSGVVTWVAINVPSGALAASSQALDIDMEGTTIDTGFGLYRSTGALVDSDTLDGTDALPQLTYGAGFRNPPGNGLPYNGRDGAADITPGTYYLAINGGAGAFGAGWAATNTGANTGSVTVRARWFSNAPSDPPPFVATLSPEAAPGTFVSADVAVNTGVVTWVRLQLPSGVSLASGQSLDVDTEGSNLAPANNPNIGIYQANGALLNALATAATDTDDGTDLQAQLSYGFGRRSPPGNGFYYDGRNAADVPGGTYYIAINGGAGAFTTGFAPTNTGANTGTVTIRARYYASNSPLEVPAAQDLGVIGTTNQPQVLIPLLAAAEVRWFKFTTTQESSDASTFWVDIDTNLSTSVYTDTHIGLFSSTGAAIANDDDDGPNGTSSFAFSALSHGAATPVRVYGGSDWVDGDGRDPDLPPGTYYLVVGRFTLNFGPNPNNFAIGPTGVAALDTFNLNIRTNLPGGPTACNAADIATAGNPDPNAGPDGFLTGDDFDLFINAFFNELTRPNGSFIADLVDGDGNPPPDNFLTGSDFDYFLAKFFQGC